MLFNDKNSQIREFEVNKDYGDDESFFRLKTENGEVLLNKLQFQQGIPLPDTLKCRVKGYNGTTPIIGHNMPQYVSDFYADGFSKGQEFEFTVLSTPDNQRGFYRLTDNNGLIFKLHDTRTALAKGQSVKCKFDTINPNFFSLRRSINDAQFQMLTLSDFARVALLHGVSAAKIEQFLKSVPELADAMDELNHGRSVWVITAIRALRPIMSKIFRELVEKRAEDSVADIILGYKRILLYLLQGSGFLRNIHGSERTQLQNELTAQLEQLDIFRQTLHIITNHDQRKFIDGLLNNLKESGYIYHPTTQFSIMMLLFRMSPELVNTSLGTIFDTLMGWDLETWKTEPFRQAFVDQFEIYITESREDISHFLMPETPSENETIEKVLTSIAIQQSLANDKDNIDSMLNTSLFFRYLALLRTTKASVLLTKSYFALMGVKLPTDYTWSDIKEPTMMMTRAAVDPPKNATLGQTTKYFVNGKVEVEVGANGISIGHTDYDAVNVIPNKMLDWIGLGVNVNLKRSINAQKIKTLEGHAEFWHNIEDALFSQEIDTPEQISTRRMPDIDDTVRIVIERVITSGHDFNKVQAFECRIVDDHFIESKGILPAENIINYNLHGVTVGTFRHDNGEHMMFDAQVVDIDDNDNLIFSLQESVQPAIRDMAYTGESSYCVITKDNGRSYSAISELGYGLYINKDDSDAPPFHRGTVVKVTITGYNKDAIQSEIEEGPIDNHPFYNAKALHNILLAIAVTPDQDEDSGVQLEEEETITSDRLREVIDILRYYAITTQEGILRSFDYLSYARLLALIIEDESLAREIKAHKDLLQLHQHYAKNKSLFLDDILNIVEGYEDNIFIQRLARRLKIVACLGHSEYNTKLWEVVNQSGNDTERELAQMVLSYNMLYDLNHEDTVAASIKDKIAKKLDVSSEQRNLKYYGSESQYVEFKSSLVYPAQKGRAGISMADPDKQEFEILHIIAGFLNTMGGTLYLGVNDDHYERGLAEDFTFYRMDTSDRNTKYRRNIRTLDNLANYLQNLIDSSFSLGKNAGDYAKTAIDEESTKGVIMVKVDPCPHIVYLDGNIYVRHSAKTEPLIRNEEKELFIADRKRLYQQLKSAAGIEDTEEEPAKEPQVTKKTNYETVVKDEVTKPATDTDNDTDNGLQTSKIRNNVLHEYNDPDHFVTPAAYIRFVNDNEYIVTKDEWSIDPDNDRLVLTVKDEDLEGYLLMVYDGEQAVKVRMRDLLECNLNETYQHYNGHKLVFACPIDQNWGLYSLHLNSKNTFFERITPIDNILLGKMNAEPQRLFAAECSETKMYETVSPAKVTELKDISSTTMKRTQLGALVKGTVSLKLTLDDAKKEAYNKLK